MTKEPAQKAEVQKPPEKLTESSARENLGRIKSKLEGRVAAIKNSVLDIAKKHPEAAEELRDIERLDNQLVKKGQEAGAVPGADSANETVQEDRDFREKVSEAAIKRLEKEKGIETDEDKVAEASLLIDKKFLDVLIVSDRSTSLERIFGDKAWADWLNARIAAKNHGSQNLDLDFIVNLHTKLARHTNPQIAGEIRDLQITCGDYKNLGRPVAYTNEQIDAIKADPNLSFHQMGINPNEGIITFPSRMQSDQKVDGLTTESVIRALITDVCTWYNGEKQKSGYDPYVLAAELQRRIISIHPFNNSNGRLSRILMNWSLENDGLPPSVLEDPNDDILVSPDEWIQRVKEGSKRYASMEARKEEMQKAKVKDIAELMGLDDERTFYKYVYIHVRKAPRIPRRGKVIDHRKYDDFNRGLRSEMAMFNKEFTSNSKVDYTYRIVDGVWDNTPKFIDQGGLVSQLYINVVGQQSAGITFVEVESYKQRRFFSDIEVFRGAGCKEPIDDNGVLGIFGHFVGLDSGYRTSVISGVPTNSIQEVSGAYVAQSLEEYNQMLRDAYLTKHHGKKYLKNITKGTGLIYKGFRHFSLSNISRGQQVLRGESLRYNPAFHTNEPTEESPFVSTSTNKSVVDRYVAYERDYGVLFKAFSPKKAGILGYGTKQRKDKSDIPFFSNSKFLVEDKGFGYAQKEVEIMIPGGMDPASIYSVEVYRRKGRYDKYHRGQKVKTMDANRVIKDGNEYVVINDYKTDPDNPEKRMYTLRENGVYEKVEDNANLSIIA